MVSHRQSGLADLSIVIVFLSSSGDPNSVSTYYQFLEEYPQVNIKEIWVRALREPWELGPATDGSLSKMVSKRWCYKVFDTSGFCTVLVFNLLSKSLSVVPQNIQLNSLTSDVWSTFPGFIHRVLRCLRVFSITDKVSSLGFLFVTICSRTELATQNLGNGCLAWYFCPIVSINAYFLRKKWLCLPKRSCHAVCHNSKSVMFDSVTVFPL